MEEKYRTYYKVKRKKYSTFRIFQSIMNAVMIVSIVILYQKNVVLTDAIIDMKNKIEVLAGNVNVLSDSVLHILKNFKK